MFLADWYQGLAPLTGESGVLSRDYWDQVMAVKTAVNKEIEEARNRKEVGSGLSAEVDLYVAPDLKQHLAVLGDELRFVLITSAARLNDEGDAGQVTEVAGLRVKITPSAYTKCVRCWHYRADVGSHPDHPEACARCVENVAGAGEKRLFA